MNYSTGIDLVVHAAGPFQRKEHCNVLEVAISKKVGIYRHIHMYNIYAIVYEHVHLKFAALLLMNKKRWNALKKNTKFQLPNAVYTTKI